MSNNISDPPRGGGIRRGRGGARGRPVKKAGPSPARHIPWPEVICAIALTALREADDCHRFSDITSHWSKVI